MPPPENRSPGVFALHLSGPISAASGPKLSWTARCELAKLYGMHTTATDCGVGTGALGTRPITAGPSWPPGASWTRSPSGPASRSSAAPSPRQACASCAARTPSTFTTCRRLTRRNGSAEWSRAMTFCPELCPEMSQTQSNGQQRIRRRRAKSHSAAHAWTFS